MNDKLLKSGPHPGFNHLKSKVGVYRCRLYPQTSKDKPEFADYEGLLHLTGSKARIRIWVHVDGTLGLSLEKITPSQQK